jgi:hypothetical protein
MRGIASVARRVGRNGEEGQALTETALLCFLILAVGAGAEAVLRRPVLLDALGASMRSFYFALSLPFP